MNIPVAIAPVRKNVRVNASLEHAFDTFTAGLTRWWPKGHGISKKPIAKVIMEPKLGGRWLEICEDGSEVPVGTIIVWERPHRFVMLWQVNSDWQPDMNMKSEVDVRFTADGDATNVELLHHKFETMGAEGGGKLREDVNGGWPGLLEKYVIEAERK